KGAESRRSESDRALRPRRPHQDQTRRVGPLGPTTARDYWLAPGQCHQAGNLPRRRLSAMRGARRLSLAEAMIELSPILWKRWWALTRALHREIPSIAIADVDTPVACQLF